MPHRAGMTAVLELVAVEFGHDDGGLGITDVFRQTLFHHFGEFLRCASARTDVADERRRDHAIGADGGACGDLRVVPDVDLDHVPGTELEGTVRGARHGIRRRIGTRPGGATRDQRQHEHKREQVFQEGHAGSPFVGLG
jgi:hypothetical protein